MKMNNEMELKGFLPLGSVILLEGGEKRLMIVGRKQMLAENKKVFDYSAVLFPEGYQDAGQLYLFNAEDIAYVFQMGLLDSEEISFQKFLSETSQTYSSVYFEAKAKIETAIQNVRKMNDTINAEWKGQAFKDYLKAYKELEGKISGLGQLLENANDLLAEYQASKNSLDELSELEGVRVEKVENFQSAAKLKEDLWKEIRESEVGEIHKF